MTAQQPTANVIQLPEKKQKSKTKVAVFDDYIKLIETVFKEPKRDIFSGQLMYWHEINRLLQPVDNDVSLLKSAAFCLKEKKNIVFQATAIDYHLAAYTHQREPELLVEIPKWDKIDRFAALSAFVTLLPNDYGINEHTFYYFLSDWFSRMFQRLFDPFIQNRILILKGNQNIGKDWFIEHLIGGLGQFAPKLNLVHGDKDTFLQLHEGLVMNISEFDKTARTEVSLLKDLITTPNTHIRAPYDRRPTFRHCRCSFISSCNINDILRDPTGNRRYVVFDLEKIDWKYPRTEYDSIQLLAQGLEFAKQQIAAPEEEEAKMKAYLEDRTPQDLGQEVVELFDKLANESLGGLTSKQYDFALEKGWLPNDVCKEIIVKMSEELELPHNRVRQKLCYEGRRKRVNIEQKVQRGYKFTLNPDLVTPSDTSSEIVTLNPPQQPLDFI